MIVERIIGDRLNIQGLLFSMYMYGMSSYHSSLPSERWKKWFMKRGYGIDVPQDWDFLCDLWRVTNGRGI